MKKLDAFKTFLLLQGGLALFFSTVATLNMVYQVEIVQLNPLQLVLVGTVLEATCFVFEIPTGIVADVYSRRLSIIIGVVLWGLGFILEGAIPKFESILLAQIIWGIGYTFTSGATEAWISDEIGEARAAHAFMRGAQVEQVADLAGIGFSVAIAGISLQAPIVAGGAALVGLGIFLVLFMPEHAFVPAPRENRNSIQQMGRTLRGGLKMVQVRPVLLTILGTMALYGAFSEGFDRLWTPHVLDNFTLPTFGPLGPVAWFGLVRAGGIILGLIAVEVARRRVDTSNNRSVAWALFGVDALIAVGVIAFGLATDLTLVVVLLLAIMPLRRVTAPLQTAWINWRLDSQVRATVISMSAQADAFGQIIGGPILGAIATLATTRIEMVVAGLALAPVLVLFARTARQDQTETMTRGIVSEIAE